MGMTRITITSSEWTVLTKMLEVESEDVVTVPKGVVCVIDRQRTLLSVTE